MKASPPSGKFFLFSYFLVIIFLGTLLLSLPAAWAGNEELKLVDRLFTATSAVCVTGLITVDTAEYTLAGQIIILLLIQAGGLGIISFSTIYILLPLKRISLRNRNAISTFVLDFIESEPKLIVRKIILFTLTAEAIGTFLLYLSFRRTESKGAFFTSLFHAVSAFCNAGFSTFSTNLEAYFSNAAVCLVISFLVILGGLGFITLLDVEKTLVKKRRKFSLHTKIVLFVTVLLLVGGTAFYFVFESTGSLKGYPSEQRLLASFFQAVTPRTAGFNTIPQDSLSYPSKLFTIPLMFVGGAPGSIAGGIKVTTFFLVALLALRGRDANQEISAFKRKIPSRILTDASVFANRAVFILFLSIFTLVISENIAGTYPGKSLLPLIFESFSAFGTVGLSLGITPHLSVAGKMVIVSTMFAGRVGLISIAMGGEEKYSPYRIDYPREEVMIG
jgi:trk system potassium uptake protein TrkH